MYRSSLIQQMSGHARDYAVSDKSIDTTESGTCRMHLRNDRRRLSHAARAMSNPDHPPRAVWSLHRLSGNPGESMPAPRRIDLSCPKQNMCVNGDPVPTSAKPCRGRRICWTDIPSIVASDPMMTIQQLRQITAMRLSVALGVLDSHEWF